MHRKRSRQTARKDQKMLVWDLWNQNIAGNLLVTISTVTPLLNGMDHTISIPNLLTDFLKKCTPFILLMREGDLISHYHQLLHQTPFTETMVVDTLQQNMHIQARKLPFRFHIPKNHCDAPSIIMQVYLPTSVLCGSLELLFKLKSRPLRLVRATINLITRKVGVLIITPILIIQTLSIIALETIKLGNILLVIILQMRIIAHFS
mmetsp:Transcript_27702/g.40892  ORF Transcript_27702/g.40892 Transcript_27702/m.40892 type:complete len:205 (-) Transcript_27702:834-1448(-)